PVLQLIGGIVAHFDPNVTKWLQGSLNVVVGSSLVVDGLYGPRTIDAVKAFQTKAGITVDGLAGLVTQAALPALPQQGSSNGRLVLAISFSFSSLWGVRP